MKSEEMFYAGGNDIAMNEVISEIPLCFWNVSWDILIEHYEQHWVLHLGLMITFE